MAELEYKPLETLLELPLAANLNDALAAIRALTQAVHEINSKVEFVATESSITIPPSNNFGG